MVGQGFVVQTAPFMTDRFPFRPSCDLMSTYVTLFEGKLITDGCRYTAILGFSYMQKQPSLQPGLDDACSTFMLGSWIVSQRFVVQTAPFMADTFQFRPSFDITWADIKMFEAHVVGDGCRYDWFFPEIKTMAAWGWLMWMPGFAQPSMEGAL